MSRARHNTPKSLPKRADGGAAPMKVAGNPNVFKEADERKKGGRTKKRAAGGKVNLGQVTGGSVRPRLDRPGRKVGGRVGADKSPLSSAHGTTAAEKTPAPGGSGS